MMGRIESARNGQDIMPGPGIDNNKKGAFHNVPFLLWMILFGMNK